MSVPIAVVGMACRLPGAASPEQFWDSLTAGTDAITEVPRNRFDADALVTDEPEPGRLLSRWGGFVPDIDRFDAAFFGISPREAERMDPQQRMLLEVVWEALEDAGVPATDLAGERVGTFVGAITRDYHDIVARAGVLDVHSNIGTTASALAGRVAWFLDLRGPSVHLDAACASGLAAVHLACASIAAGESTAALACATNLVLLPNEGITFSQGEMLSRRGRCRFAAEDADGFVRSDGVAAVLLKPLRDAIVDGDTVHAVIRGSAMGNEGRSSGTLLTPSEHAQAGVLRAAYAAAGVDPCDVDLVEAHGTGTRVGDAVELRALGAVFADRDEPLPVGSAKSNIGHTEATSGLVGLIKAALCLRHGAVPASLHSGTPTSQIDWTSLPLTVPQETVPLAEVDRARIAGISSFGITGTNVHLVLAEHRRTPSDPVPGEPEPGPLVLSAHDDAALRALLVRVRAQLAVGGAGRDCSVAEICASAATRRAVLPARAAVCGNSHDELVAALDAWDGPAHSAAATTPRTVFVFAGHGSQWTGMGRELLETSVAFRTAMDRCDDALRPELGWSVAEKLRDGDELTGSHEIQPALWAMQVSLAAEWAAQGVRPDRVLGHSMGEVAAACVAGALTLAEGAAVICRRSALAYATGGAGLMASVDLGGQDVRAALVDHPDVCLAAYNGPSASVVSGPAGSVRRLLTQWTDEDVFCREIPVDYASHSILMDPLREPLLAALGQLTPVAARVPMTSTTLGGEIEGPELDAAYWVRNLREPVLLDPVVAELVAEGPVVFVECGPHPLLLSALRDRIRLSGHGAALGSTHRDEPESCAMRNSLAALVEAGGNVDWRARYGRPVRHVALPHYPWQGGRYWAEETAPARAVHPLLGPLPAPGTTTWSGTVDLRRTSWLADHRVQDTVVLCGTVHIEMVLAFAGAGLGRPVELRDVAYHAAIFVEDDAATELRIAIDAVRAGSHRFRVESRSAAGWTVNATGEVLPARSDPFPDIAAAGGPSIDGAEFYRRSDESGNQWWGMFRAIRELHHRAGRADGVVCLPPTACEDGFGVHPALLDGCAQMIAATALDDDAGAFVLGGVDRVRLTGRPRGPLTSRAVRGVSRDTGTLRGDIVVLDAEGTPVIELTGIWVRYLDPDPAPAPPTDAIVYTPVWRPRALRPAPLGPAPTTDRPGWWLVLADAGLGADLGGRLPGNIVLVGRAEGGVEPAPGVLTADPDRPDDLRRSWDAATARYPGRPCMGVVHLWAADAGIDVDSGVRLGARAVLHLLHALEAAGAEPRLWLVTRGAQAVGEEREAVAVGQATLWGFGRAVAQELPGIRCSLIDLPATPEASDVVLLAAELSTGGAAPADQVAFRRGRRHVHRLRPGGDAPAPGSIGTSGRAAAPGDRDGSTPPGPGEVAVRIRLAATGGIRAASGVVTALGPGVTAPAVGELVIVLDRDQHRGDVTVVHAQLARPLPPGVTEEDALSVVAPYLVAERALDGLRPGARVLVHGAAGPLELAAVQVARERGYEVIVGESTGAARNLVRLVTAGTVVDDQDRGYADAVLAATRGHGVDLVLGRPPTELGVDAPLARDGRQIDIRWPGRPAAGLNRPGTWTLELDPGTALLDDPLGTGSLLGRALALIAAGVLQPLPYEVDGSAESPGGTWPTRIAWITGTADTAPVPFARPDATYLVTGGLGGIGRAAAQRLAERGARHLLLVGRTPLSGHTDAADQPVMLEGFPPGVDVRYAALDTADEVSLAAVLDERRLRGEPPVRGVLHAAGVIDYGVVGEIDGAALSAPIHPKVAGGWALHRVLRAQELDWFVLFSSASALLGSPRLAAYGAANAGLDALAHHRRAAGLPAMSVNWGFWSSVGMMARHLEGGGRDLAPRGTAYFSPAEGLDLLERLIAGRARQVAVMATDWSRWAASYPAAARDPFLAEVVATTDDADAPDTTVDPPEASDRTGREEVTNLVRDRVATVLRLPASEIDVGSRLVSAGLDSLMATELRRHLRNEYGVDVSIAKLLRGQSIADLVESIVGDG